MAPSQRSRLVVEVYRDAMQAITANTRYRETMVHSGGSTHSVAKLGP